MVDDMDANRPIIAEAEATRLATRLGSRALAEARYQLSLAEARFQRSLAVTGKELASLDHWAAVSKLLMEQAPLDQIASPPASARRR